MLKQILMVEDDVAEQLKLQRMITKIDPETRIDSVLSAEAAIRSLSENGHKSKYDLVLCDLMLPGFDGLVLWEFSRKRYPELDFIFLSGIGYDEWCKMGEYGELPSLLRKPVDERMFRQAWEERFSLYGGISG